MVSMVCMVPDGPLPKVGMLAKMTIMAMVSMVLKLLVAPMVVKLL